MPMYACTSSNGNQTVSRYDKTGRTTANMGGGKAHVWTCRPLTTRK